MQPGDVPITFTDSTALELDYGFRPQISIKEGLKIFAEWYKNIMDKHGRASNEVRPCLSISLIRKQQNLLCSRIKLACL